MPAKMMQFVSVPPAMPDKRQAPRPQGRTSPRSTAASRPTGRPSRRRAASSAACRSARSIARCTTTSPTGCGWPTEGRLEEAYELSSATNNMPEICGRICPQDRLCEGNCVIEQSGHGAVTIGAVEKYITDTAFDLGWVQPVRAGARAGASRSASSAPARPGLACAEELRKQGWQVHVYDRYDRVGGLLIYGIPGFKLEKPIVERRARLPARRRHPLPSRQRHRRRRPDLRRAAPAPRRRVHRDRRLQGARPRGARQRPARHRAGAGLPHRQQPQGPGRCRPRLRRRHA